MQVRAAQDIRRRRRRLAWIPAILGVLLIAGVVTATLVAQNRKLGVPVPAPTADSRFDAKGLDYIARSRITRVNIAVLPISTSSLGLTANQVVHISSAAGLPEYLQLEGNRRYAQLTADAFTITAKDGFVRSIRWSSADLTGFPDLSRELAGAFQFGLSSAQATSALDAVRLHNHDHSPFAQTFPPVATFGVPVTVQVAADGNGSYSVNYELDLRGV